MKKALIILMFLFISNNIYAQKGVGYYFIDHNYYDTTYIFENDSLYNYEIASTDGPSYQYCKGKKCNGLIEEYYINGKLKHSGLYSEGKIRNGKSMNFYVNGSPQTAGNFKNGNRIGQWIWYSNLGLVEMINQYDSIGNTIMELSFYENGKIMDYQLLVNDSSCLKLFTTFYETGELNTHYFQPECGNKNEKRIFREYYENGTIKLKGQFLNRQKNGLFEYYNIKGDRTKIEEYKNGKLIKTTANKT
jgi:antitoxin component YwqK of YwqJK toxin-antitoxin module